MCGGYRGAGLPCFVALIAVLLSTTAPGQSSEPALDHAYQPPDEPAIQLKFPSYDPENPEHVLIRNDRDWTHVNDPDRRVFFVTPGDYRDSGTIRLKVDGRENSPRWLLYHDPDNRDNNTHPYHMPENQRVLLHRLVVDDADHWRVDRLQLTQSSTIKNKAHHNILNRMLMLKPGFRYGNDPLYIRGDSRHNTLQNSVIGNSRFDPEEDVVGVVPVDAPFTRIVSNEIFNMAGDGIQAGPADVSGAIGTKILDNDLYITPRMYADGEGNRQRTGTFAGAENAIDIKQASVMKQHPIPEEQRMTIAYNRMWGFRRTDSAVGGTGSGGSHVVVHYEPASYIRVHHNIFFDGRAGYTISKNEQLGPIHHHHVHDNLFWNLAERAIKPRHIDDARFERNIVINSGRFLAMWYSPPDTVPERNVIRENVLINVEKSGANSKQLRSGNNRITKNAYYASDSEGEKRNERLHFPLAEDAKHEPLRVEIRQITDPQTVTIPHGRVTDQSPHDAWFPDR